MNSNAHHAPPDPSGYPVYVADMERRGMGPGVLFGLALSLLLFVIAGWPKLGAPAIGGAVVGITVLVLGGYRNIR